MVSCTAWDGKAKREEPRSNEDINRIAAAGRTGNPDQA
jgi:hypothetical protein